MELEQGYEQVLQDGFSAMLQEWRDLSVTLGQPVNVVGGGRNFSGVAIDIDNDGALLVETSGGVERVLAGDVSIRPTV